MIATKKIKNGFTLTEIMLACVLMAFAFLPIMGVMSSSIKATEKDESTQKAVALCQEKLNMCLQMPFEDMPLGSHGGDTNKSLSSKNTTNQLILKLGPETFDGVVYKSKLEVVKERVTFSVPTCDFALKGDEKNKNNPSAWGWTYPTYTFDDMVKRYTVTVVWRDKGGKVDKNYTLSSLKADIRKR